MKRIAILGSTGSIGRQALSVIALHPERFRVAALVARRSRELLFEQARAFRPEVAGLVEPVDESLIPDDLRFCRWVFGAEALCYAVTQSGCDDVLAAVVGMAGLEGVLTALARGKRVLLANKEALVAGGALVTDAARAQGEGCLLPVDSEHSAIFQCLQATPRDAVEKLYLTCSGGPFRTWDKAALDRATPEQALRHPNWSMGAKITVDSATLFNKALELIEAKWLFSMPQERIEVVVHPQSVVHSAVCCRDGAVLAQLGTPDMRLPILYAMAYPDRLTTGAPPLDLFALSGLTFEKPDENRFPSLRMARECLRAGGAAACVLNAANEVAVERFLQPQQGETLPLGRIFTVVEEVLQRLGAPRADTLEDVLDADRRARATARLLLDG